MTTICFGIFFCIIILGAVHCDILTYLDDDSWSTEHIIERDGYPFEVHNITTEDGYILTVHRIPGKKGATPVLLQHGLLLNSALWVALGKGNALAYLLVDEGYDVWLGNNRGNSYGLNHINLTSDDDEFWNFSYHEMGVFDLPAMIDYIWNSTNQYPLYIGHSQGTTVSYIMAVERPEVANSLKILISLAPVAYTGHVWDSFGRFMIPFFIAITKVLQFVFGLHTYLPQDYPFKYVFKCWCAFLAIGQINCLNGFAHILGYEESDMFNMAKLPIVLTNFPSGTSLKNIYFYGQHVSNGRFDKYDYGETENLEIYNAPISPEYDLTKVFPPIALIYGDSDVFVQPEDLDKIMQSFPNIVDKYAVNASGFTHMDFVWGIEAKNAVYDHVVELVNKYNNP